MCRVYVSRRISKTRTILLVLYCAAAFMSLSMIYYITATENTPRLRKVSLTSFYSPEAITATFRFAWDNYEKYAMGYDQLAPFSKSGTNYFEIGCQIVDGLGILLF